MSRGVFCFRTVSLLCRLVPILLFHTVYGVGVLAKALAISPNMRKASPIRSFWFLALARYGSILMGGGICSATFFFCGGGGGSEVSQRAFIPDRGDGAYSCTRLHHVGVARERPFLRFRQIRVSDMTVVSIYKWLGIKYCCYSITFYLINHLGGLSQMDAGLCLH